MNNAKTAQLNAAVRRMATRGKTQREISAALGISQPTVSRMLGNDEPEDTPLLRMIAKSDRLNELYAEISRAYDNGEDERCELLWNEVAAIKATL